LPAVALTVACGEGAGPLDQLPRDLSVAEGELIEANNAFAFKLFREINRQDTTGGNVFISPLSVAMALGMAYNGAAGTTRDAMQETLELQGLTIDEINESYRSVIDLLRNLDPAVEFSIANSVWYDLGETLQPSFLDVAATYFDAVAAQLDFASADAAPTINAWVSDATHGKILQIVLDPIPPDIVSYLINAIYFKGDWTYQFDKDLTETRPFRLAADSSLDVDMMSYATESPVRSATTGDYTRVVDLSYGDGAYSMTIVLPPEVDGVSALAETITEDQWDAWVGALDSTNMYILMPKLTLEWEDSLNSVLRALGMGVAFQPVADFSNMFVVPGACIDEVRHKTFVDVNEEGTEAAAVTSVSFLRSFHGIEIDHPFLFAIRERHSGTILFMGKIVDPTRTSGGSG